MSWFSRPRKVLVEDTQPDEPSRLYDRYLMVESIGYFLKEYNIDLPQPLLRDEPHVVTFEIIKVLATRIKELEDDS